MNIVAVLIVGGFMTSVAIWTVISVLRKEKSSANRLDAHQEQIESFAREALNAFVEKGRRAVQERIQSELNPMIRLDASQWSNLTELEETLEKTFGFQRALVRSPNLSNAKFLCETCNRAAGAELARREAQVAESVGNNIVDLRRVLLEAGGALTPKSASALST